MLKSLDEDPPPPLPPKKNSPHQVSSGFSGWDGEPASSDDEEEFDKLIDRDEDKEVVDEMIPDGSNSESEDELQ